MQEAFLITLGKMVEILGVLLVGFCLRKWKVLPEQTPKVLSGLTAKLFMPCLVFTAMLRNCTVTNLTENGPVVLYGAAIALFCFLISFPLASLFERKNRVLMRQYRYSVAVPNSGAAGLPLAIALGGSFMVFQMNLYNLLLSVITYSWGIMQLIPEGKGGIKSALRRLVNPVLGGLALGMVLGLLGGSTWIPAPIRNLADSFGNCYVTAAVMLTGYTIAGFDLRGTLKDVKIYLFAIVRLLLIPLALLGLCWLVKAPAIVTVLAVLVYAGPCGMNPVIFATEHGVDNKKVAGILLVTMPLAVVTIPLLYALTVKITGWVPPVG